MVKPIHPCFTQNIKWMLICILVMSRLKNYLIDLYVDFLNSLYCLTKEATDFFITDIIDNTDIELIHPHSRKFEFSVFLLSKPNYFCCI